MDKRVKNGPCHSARRKLCFAFFALCADGRGQRYGIVGEGGSGVGFANCKHLGLQKKSPILNARRGKLRLRQFKVNCCMRRVQYDGG